MDYNSAKSYIIGRLEKELSKTLYYHCIIHTLDVADAAERYAKMENLNDEDLLLLKTAALFHDCGFLVRYIDNEEVSVQIVKKILPGFGYSPLQIEVITKIIYATKCNQKPENILEKIICDSDLDYLGRDDFFMNGIRLKREKNEHGIPTSLKEWYIQEYHFLLNHKYYTKSAIELRQKKKMMHLDEIKELLQGKV
ncbi:MAG: HD domain-containing protein [Bacteroidetes bacterium]|nr:HD domain-containing protein [Bacteroidota bacterium]